MNPAQMAEMKKLAGLGPGVMEAGTTSDDVRADVLQAIQALYCSTYADDYGSDRQAAARATIQKGLSKLKPEEQTAIKDALTAYDATNAAAAAYRASAASFALKQAQALTALTMPAGT